jgi:hypothetical protein
MMGAVPYTLTLFMVPGLLLVAATVGSLIPGAAINAVVNFAICFLLLRLLPLFKNKSAQC